MTTSPLPVARRLLPSPPPPPDPRSRPRRRPPGAGLVEGRATLSRLLLCLATAGALTTHHLRSVAEHQQLGPGRTVLLAAATALDHQAHTWWLDRPDQALAHLLGRDSTEVPTSGQPEAAAPEPAAPRAQAGPRRAGAPSPRYGPPRPTARPSAGPDGPSGPSGLSAPPGLATPPEPTAPSGPVPPTQAGVERERVPEGPAEPAGPIRPVDRDHRLRVWAGGDSLGQYVGNRLLAPLADRQLTDVELDYHISTGLARPDFFDWPDHLRAVMARPTPPEALVLMIGGNDNQPMLGPAGADLATGSGPWLAEYRRRVAEIMDIAGTGGGRLWWIGLPPMRDPAREVLSHQMDRIVAEEAARRPWVTHVELTGLFSAPGGGYASRLTGPDGRSEVARAPDGVHITAAGSAWVADRVWPTVAHRWGLAAPG